MQEESAFLRSVRVQPCIRPHMMVSPARADVGRPYLRQELMWADRDPRRSSHFCRLPCKTSHPAGVDPNHCPAFGTGKLQENDTTLYRRRRSAMPNNGDVPSDRWIALRSQRDPDFSFDQAAGFKTAPSGTTPSMTNLHSAISSFRASATTMILRIRGPVDPTRSRNQQT